MRRLKAHLKTLARRVPAGQRIEDRKVMAASNSMPEVSAQIIVAAGEKPVERSDQLGSQIANDQPQRFHGCWPVFMAGVALAELDKCIGQSFEGSVPVKRHLGEGQSHSSMERNEMFRRHIDCVRQDAGRRRAADGELVSVVMSYTFSRPYREERPQAVGAIKHLSEIGDLAFRKSQNRINVFE